MAMISSSDKLNWSQGIEGWLINLSLDPEALLHMLWVSFFLKYLRYSYILKSWHTRNLFNWLKPCLIFSFRVELKTLMKFEWIYLACMLETTIICFGSVLLNISLTKAYRKEFPCRYRRLHVPDYWHTSSVKELISRKGSMYIQYMKQNHWGLTETSKCEASVLPSHLYSGWRLL